MVPLSADHDHEEGGAHAALDPETVAGTVAESMLRGAPAAGGAAFVDHEGRALPW